MNKMFNMEELNSELVKSVLTTKQKYPSEIIEEGNYKYHLLDLLLTNDYINEKILSVPLEDWYDLGCFFNEMYNFIDEGLHDTANAQNQLCQYMYENEENQIFYLDFKSNILKTKSTYLQRIDFV